jgi:hypothetical protein
MVKNGEYQKALERYVWFHNHILETDSSMKGVRLSFALSHWKKLGDKYPPAIVALKEVRDKKTNQIISSGESKSLFIDVDAINRTLSESSKTINLFELISKKYPKLAGEVITYALDDLLAAKSYELIKANVRDITEQYHRIESNYKRDIKEFPTRDEKLIAYIHEDFSKEVVQLIDYCIAVRNKHAAIQIQSEALALINDTHIRNAL